MKEKKLRAYLKGVSVLLLLLAVPLLRTIATPNAETYKHDAQGLEKQFEPFLKAFQKGDDRGMDENFAVFRIPKAKEWFGNYFSAEDAAKLVSVYDREISEAESSLIEDMNRADPGSRYHVRCEPRGDSGAGQGGAHEYGFRPLKPIAVEQFQFEFRSSAHDQKFLFIANFVYVDGAYRFVGGGGVPFWAKPGVGR